MNALHTLWPSGTKYISGPASMHLYSKDASKHIVLFGDVHFSYGNSCALNPLDAHVVSVHDLIRDALKDPKLGASLIVEYPYVNAAMRRAKGRMWYYDRIQSALERNSLASTQLSVLLHQIVGVPAPVTGMLSKLFASVPSAGRVTAADLRSEPNVHVWDKALNRSEAPERVAAQLFKDPRYVVEHMRALLTRDDCVDYCKNLFKDTDAAQYLTNETTANGRHELRRALLALPAADRAQVVRFASSLRDEALALHRKLRRRPTVQNAKLMITTMQALVMDTYVACILAAQLRDENIKTILMYVGDYHMQHASSFLSDWLGIKRTFKQNIKWSKTQEVQRCIVIAG